ncbi:MAG: PepSY domain-containing protein [Clostridiales Family XIII bacterium]|nr:PepSY domain-containing protein [Clostridiales Family XIII bacterium]
MNNTVMCVRKRLVAAALAFVFAVGGFAALSATDAYAASGEIGLKKAKSIALKKAGLKAGRVRFTTAHREYDDGRYIYEIEFYRGAWEYSFEIAARTGRILEWDKDYEYEHERGHGHEWD